MIRTVLVTGANGLLGAQCVAALAKDSSYRILAVWHNGSERLYSHPPFNVEYVQCDIADTEAVRQLFAREHVDAVLHTAALLPDASPCYDARAVLVNVAATVNLAAAARDEGCTRFVYCSSVSVYGATTEVDLTFSEDFMPAPEDTYAWTKLAGEQYLQLCCADHAMRGICLRLSGLHGVGRKTGLLYNLVRNARVGAPIHISSAATPFQFLHLNDAVELILHALSTPIEDISGYTIFNAASCIAPSLFDIATKAVLLSGKNSSIVIGETQSASRQIMNTERQARWFKGQTHGFVETLHDLSAWLGTDEGSGS
jgi:UDP-glucuronate 4-epimerase